ncbi:MAG: DUF305 domain-containing protein [Aeromicrobium sp.]|uniref:DUF305 domain-containing protein n=1 Tax=Aeromicrobium sp. TaxID=1871063 RepID=UPI0039E4D3A8
MRRLRRDGRIWAALAFVLAGALLGCAATLLFVGPRESEDVEPSEVDVGFAQDMGVHHQQALDMSALALANSDDQFVLAMAQQILQAQAGERGILRGWLTLWKAPQLPSGPPMEWMAEAHEGHGDHGSHEEGMPGMATPAQMQELAELEGAAFDAEFVALMTAHHEGGVMMARYAADHAALPEVRSLAMLMVEEQIEELSLLAGRAAA